jgi:pSer/pThr/pTyr-binding forkhead associated (FHA) protein
MIHSWLIGTAADCDIPVDRSGVSSHHCRLTRQPGGDVTLEDLGSSEGTFVNGVRLSAPAAVTPGDAVTLGTSVPLPWPVEAIPPGWRILTIGREPDNDFVVSLGTVSSYHARLIWNGGTGQATIEDLGSSNGTALGSPERRITRAPLAPGDMVFLGTHPVPAANLLGRLAASAVVLPALTFRGRPLIIGRDPDCDQVIDLPFVSGRHARLTASGGKIVIQDMDSANGTYVNGQRVDRPCVVVPGDQIRLGTYTLELVVADFTPVPGPSARIVAAAQRYWPLAAIALVVLVGGGVYLGISASRHPRGGESAAPEDHKPRGEVHAPAPAAPVEPAQEGPDLVSAARPGRPAPAIARPPLPSPPAPASEPDSRPPKPPSDQPAPDVVAWANSLDLTSLAPDDEDRLGRELRRLVLAHIKPLEEGPWIERAADAARRVSDADWTITILDSDAVSAFSFPGHQIFVCRGLFDLIGTDEDYILEFAIGHEIAHLTLRHALRVVAANTAEARKRGVDTLNQFLVPIALGYRDALEFEADAWIYRAMIGQPDNTKRTCLAFLRKLRDYAERQKFGNGRKEPDRDCPLFENHFRAHPAARERLRRLESMAAGPAPSPPLRKDEG